MTVLNIVEDYGAVGDGRTDDSQAIQQAIDETTDGDTVFIPETNDYYRVNTSSSVAVSIHTAADNVLIKGGGSGAKLVLGSPDTGYGALGIEGGTSSVPWTNITIKSLVLDGGSDGYSGTNDATAFWSGNDSKLTGKDILIEDVIFQNSVGTSNFKTGSKGISYLTFRNCTSKDSASHGFNPSGTGEGSPSDPEIRFYDIEVTNCRIAVDMNQGNHLIDGAYIDGMANGLKCGSAYGEVNHVTLKNINHRNSENKGFYQTGHSGDTWSLDIQDCLFTGHLDMGLDIEGDCSVTLNGTVMSDNIADNDGVILRDNVTLDASSGTIITQNIGRDGVNNYSNNTASIDTNYWHSVTDSPTDGGNFNITNSINEEQSEIDVPGRDEVGAFSSGGSGDSSGDGSEDPIFNDWTPRWDAGYSDWKVSSTSSNVEDSILELNASSAGRHGLSCDAFGTATDVDILGLVRVPSNDDNSSSWCRLIGRGAGSAGNETGYFVAFRDTGSLGIAKYVDGSSTGLMSAGVNFNPGSWLYVRFNITGNELKARYWNYGENEPTTWDLTATDSEITTAGWVGAGGWSTDTQQWDTFSVGKGGDSAQFVGVNDSPSVAWKNPTDGTTVSDTVTIKVAASDPEDSDDSLTTEYRIDGNSWLTASYNSTSGYYESSWDSTTVVNGDHALETRVTDSTGTSSASTITVTTDNAGDAPVVDSLLVTEVETSNSNAEFDADWQASDSDGNLNSADIALVRDSDGSTTDSTTVTINGSTATGTTRLVAADDDGSGNSYTVELAVTDGNGNTTSATTATTETEDTGEAPTIHRFSVSEAGRPDPHAKVTAIWDVSDADADLASVEIDIADSSGTVQGVSWTLSGASASDTDSFKIKDGDGKTFDLSLTVTDAAGRTTSKTVSVSA